MRSLHWLFGGLLLACCGSGSDDKSDVADGRVWKCADVTGSQKTMICDCVLRLEAAHDLDHTEDRCVASVSCCYTEGAGDECVCWPPQSNTCEQIAGNLGATVVSECPPP